MKRTIGRILFWTFLVVCGFVIVHGVEISLSPDDQVGRFLVSILLFVTGGALGGLLVFLLGIIGEIAVWLFNSAFDTNNKENPIDK